MALRIFFSSLLLTFLLNSQAQTAEQSFSQSFHTDDKSHLQLFLPGEVDLKVWNETSIRVEIGVNLPGTSAALVKELANAGRYNLVSVSVGEKLQIEAPNALKPLKLRGEVVRESYRFTVYIPQEMNVEILPVKGVELAASDRKQ